MTIESLKYINQALSGVVNYEFGEWNSEITYPYWVGEYSEQGALDEDGMNETTFMITGTTRGAWLDLENDKNKIKKALHDKIAILPNSNGLAVFFMNTLIVPVEDMELKRMQINLQIKEWEV